jgi:NAD(P)-dependent dehydrogenase (short-subunit alcohol dehydrogenase family)
MGERLKDKIAIVTGAGSSGPGWGNGKAAAVLFAREGAAVFAVDNNAEALQETLSIIEKEGGRCAGRVTDVAKADQVRAMVDACVETFDGVDVLHNNVGILRVGGPVESSEASWDLVFDVNIKSMFLTCKAAIPHMEKRGRGAIVNISSIVALRYLGVPYISYSASKGAVRSFTRAIAVEYAARGIRANTILPGLMNTPMIVEPLKGVYADGDVQEMVDMRDAQCPTGKMGDAWDVAHAALFLASDEAKYVNGAELVVDGGLTCRA